MSTARELGERIKNVMRNSRMAYKAQQIADELVDELVSLAPAEQAADLQPRPPNSEGKTLSTVRWLVELPNGMWLGAWDKEAFAAYLAASPQPPATHKGAWISVEERLPPKNTEVLIALEGMAIPSTGQYTGSSKDHEGWCYPRENCDWFDGTAPRVLYWQELPDVPGLGPDGNFLPPGIPKESEHGNV